jgi:hypothetical protein
MKLIKFRVTNFRSVDDSGWIDADDVTALIGTNEAGKTNILLPLWKLNPAKEGAIDLTSDYPRKHYNTFRTQTPQPVFIEALFDVGADVSSQLAKLTGLPANQMNHAVVNRRFDGTHGVDFPNARPPRSIEKTRANALVTGALDELTQSVALATEVELKTQMLAAVRSSQDRLAQHAEVGPPQLDEISRSLATIKLENPDPTSTLVPRFQRLIKDVAALKKELTYAHPRDKKEAVDLVISKLPKFVYYANYGNLDSEIYLPHVIANQKRTDMGTKDQAKARTLRVLFEFVKIEPQEILDLGQDPPGNLTPDQTQQMGEKKRQRTILLQSASADLTTKFRDWWKQGNYRFRFQADGNHFRIWVSDDRRPEEIELEGRSTGLQWFLSFYLVFLVEKSDAHADAILLLDEPGLSLHPLAQRDLSEFFGSLSATNQLIYTSHSPFLIDADRLDRARKVYVDEGGTTRVTPDLSLSTGDAGTEKRGAGYAVHAALGLTVAESILVGCTPIVVEGASDQHYLSAIKTVLIAAGKLKPGRELVFPPSGGVKGVKAVVSIMGARIESLPKALFDSDSAGKATIESLKKGLYAGQENSLLAVETFKGMDGCEIEDLIPTDLIAYELDRWHRPEVAFADGIKEGTPIVGQIEDWAKRQGITLKTPGWKVDLAIRIKKRILEQGIEGLPEEVVKVWLRLFEAFQQS